MLRRRLGALIGIVGLVVAAGACSGGEDGDARSGRFAGVHAEVCAAVASAGAGDLEAAQATFDDVHVGLHDLAVAAGEEDRGVAARLLEAKQRVEAELDEPSLGGLVAPTAAAVRATGGAAPDTCP